MAITHRLSATGALIVCLTLNPCGGTLFASENDLPSANPLPAAPANLTADALGRVELPSGIPLTARHPVLSISDRMLATTLANADEATDVLAQRRGGYRGRGRRGGYGGNRGAAQAEVVFGAVASITGTALLVYANRPECSSNQAATGCSYGAKVVGGAVLTGGLISLLAGAIQLR